MKWDTRGMGLGFMYRPLRRPAQGKHVNLLGLTVHLNQVVLNITAVPGAGSLLGNLLCDVAGLLNGGNLNGLLTQIVGLLNQILASL
jgi:hypothetical protein